MEGLRCAVGLIVITFLLQGLFVSAHSKNVTIISSATNSSTSPKDTEPVVLLGNSTQKEVPESSSNSTETNSEPVKISANSDVTEKAVVTLEKAGNLTDTSELESLSGNATSEASKKDKRQAQRGYTDIPLDEGPFQDVANSSPSTLPNFESDLPPLAENLNNDLPSTYPSSLNINRDPESSFFARRVGLPDPIIPPQDYAKRVGLPAPISHQDNIAAAAVPLQERVDADDNCGDACDGKPIPGEAGTDYPVLSKIPKTSFSCKSQQWPGYYADTEARCQVFWICQKHRMDAFLCPNGTLFNQQVFVCDWWFNVDCNASPEFYSRNQYLYAGPGIGIDGKPTRFRGGTPPVPALSSSSNVFAKSVLAVPRPSGVNSNPLVNQVQSTNQISRVASVTASTNSVPLSQPLPPQQQQPVRNTNSYFDSSSSNNQQRTFESNSNQKYQSVQNMLSTRMQKNPTGKPLQTSSSNQVVGGYQTNQLGLNSQSELDRRTFSSQPPQQQQHQQQQHQQQQSFSGGGGRGASYEGNNNRVSTTGRPQSHVSPSPSSPRPSSSPSSPTPRINVNIDSKSQKQTLSSFGSNNNNGGSRSISSTGRPFIQVNSDVPLFGPGSSTARPTQHSTRNPLNNFASSTANLVGSSQNINNASIVRQPILSSTLRPPVQSSTGAPSPPSRDYIPNLAPPPKPTASPSPSSTGRPSSRPEYIPPLSNHNKHSSQSHVNSLTNNNYIPPETTTPLSTGYSAPGHTPGTPLAFVDRGHIGKETQQRHSFVSSTPQPQGFHTFGSREFVGFHGQRSNQFSNVNGQREIMYSPSASNIYAEFPYSPSQQKNKQKLLELQKSKGISTAAKDIFSYPHFHGQRSNAFSDGDSVSYIQNNNKKININHGGHSQRTNPFTTHLQPSNPNSVHGVPKDHQVPHANPSASPSIHNQVHANLPQQPQQQQFQHQSQPIHHQQPILKQSGPTAAPPHPPQQSGHQQPSQNVQQYHVAVQPTHVQPPNSNQQPPHQNFQQNPNPPQQHFTQNQPQPQPSIQHYSQQQPQHNQHHPPSHLPYASPSPTPPFHQRIATIPSQNLELPSLAHGPFHPGVQQHQQPQSFDSRDGYTSLQSGSYISIATSPSPFSQQILKHSVFQGEPQPPHQQKISKSYKTGPAFVTTSHPIVSNHNNFNGFISSTGQPPYQSVSLSTTLRPPSIHSTPAPFTNAGTIQPTAYPSQNTYIAAPTQVPVQTTSPGHRQNPYLPHNHGKRTGKNNSNGNQPQYPNSIISTTINYPEGTGSLKVLQGSQGSGGRRNLVDFSYTANPTSSTPFPSSTTRFPSGKERFDHAVRSTTGRPYHSSPSPQQSYKEPLRKGSRLAGSVINKSTSSSSAIYVDNADTAESVSTPVSVSPSASASPSSRPAVATANYGLRISSTAKKRMAGAWQNYFSGNDKENSNNSTVVAEEEDV